MSAEAKLTRGTILGGSTFSLPMERFRHYGSDSSQARTSRLLPLWMISIYFIFEEASFPPMILRVMRWSLIFNYCLSEASWRLSTKMDTSTLARVAMTSASIST